MQQQLLVNTGSGPGNAIYLLCVGVPLLDLATPEGFKAAFTWLAWLHTEVLYSSEDGHLSLY